MGVHGLWELLAPVGRRVSVETLSGRRLAIDASIWMVQFMKAMRDERGEMVRNAHLFGFFRRICKLLYLRTKPVFVFDGGTPSLKRRTVIARRRQRESSQAKLRKTAEKLLLNHVMRLKELAADIKNQRQDDVAVERSNQDKMDEMLAASIEAEEEEGGSLAEGLASTSSATPCEEDDEELMLPEIDGEVDPEVFTALPPSMQRGLLAQKNKKANDAKGKRIMSDPTEVAGINSGKSDAVLRNVDQEKLDEMIAASLAAEADGSVTNNASSMSTASFLVNEDVNEDEDNEEMILPEMHGDIDPAVLAALPPSMQLDLLVQIRERLMAENRQKYQKVKKDPEKFSELQIQSYLKTVAFRREIDHVQKAASGRGFGGVQTSRIASESHREFIFSSSFTGDKKVLAAARDERNGDEQQAPKEHSANVKNSVLSTDHVSGSTPEKSQRVFDENIETYLDERGNVRVSRVRAMGMRMTRDLQRNLDLMIEMEHEKINGNKITDAGNMLQRNNTCSILRTSGDETHVESSLGDIGIFVKSVVPKSHPGQTKVGESSVGDSNLNERDNHRNSKLGTPIVISIENDGDAKSSDADDDLFARLVASDPVTISSANDALTRQFPDSNSDSDWEDGTLKSSSFSADTGLKINSPDLKANNDDSEVDWEEGFSEITENTSSYPRRETTSKGYIEEEADLQEAIKRSLEDTEYEKCSRASLEDDLLKPLGENVQKASECIDRETRIIGEGMFSTQHDKSVVDGLTGVNSREYLGASSEQVTQDASEKTNLDGEMQFIVSITPSSTKADSMMSEQVLDTYNEGGRSSVGPSLRTNINSETLCGGVTHLADDPKDDTEIKSSCHLVDMENPSSIGDSVPNRMTEEPRAYGEWVKEKSHDSSPQEFAQDLDRSPLKGIGNANIAVTEANLEEEMLILDQECMNLGDERRRLERNAESVSSEMYTECQELLQMFGIPYIIAPMEAEAQCAYLELENLVDGVVTDDSDVFLFGARSIYKNIFDDRKYVETYFMKDIESELGLTREKLIRMALLLGSDYTEGVSGIGIVNAIEVVNAFPEEDGLHNFRNWIESPDPTILGKLDTESASSTKKRVSKLGRNDMKTKSGTDEASLENSNCQDQEHKQSDNLNEDVKKNFMDTHRKMSKNWHIPLSFPSEAVTSAYTCPQVDKSTEPFTWGKPDHLVLRRLCWEKFGWVSQKSDELLGPVLEEYNKRETQLRLEAFYSFNERFAKIRSKRIKKAVKGITGDHPSELMNDAADEGFNINKKRNIDTDEAGIDNSDQLSVRTEKSTVKNQSNSRGKPTRRQSSKRRTGEVEQTNRKTGAKARGRGKGRGRGTSRVVRRGKREVGSSSLESQDTSDDDDGTEAEDMEIPMATSQSSEQVRRSGRLRKSVDYRSNDMEIDDLDQTESRVSDTEVGKQFPFKDGVSDEVVLGVNEKELKSLGNLSPVENHSKHYLDVGGGFCPSEDENETGPDRDVSDEVVLGVNEKEQKSAGNLFPEENHGKHFLEVGGGFCLSEDENEIGADRDGSHDRGTAATVSRTDVVSDFSGFLDEGDLGHMLGLSNLPSKRPFVGFPGSGRTSAYDSEQSLDHHTNNDHSASTVSPPENTVDTNGQPPIGALSAMAFLKKKRKR